MNRSEARKKVWAEKRDFICQAMKGVKKNPSYGLVRSVLMKKKWADPEYRKNQVKAQTGKVSVWNKGKKGLQTNPWKGKKRPELSGKNSYWTGRKRPELSGANHPNWKGGITAQDKLERNKFKKMIQKKVLERDDYTCQLCSTRGKDMQVDHIQSWSEYVELRFNVDNCRTLCSSCHYFITFGKPMPPTVRAWGHNFPKGGNNL